MSRTKKVYAFPIKDDAAREKIRKWVGQHNGMSILRSDYCWIGEPVGHSVDTYILAITNPNTEMLFVLSFPKAVEESQMTYDGFGDMILPE